MKKTDAMLVLVLLVPALPAARASQDRIDVPVLVILNKANEVEDLPFDALRKLFLADRTFWKESKPVKLFALEPGKSRARDLVLEKIYRMDEKKYKKYWALRVFKGEVSSAPFEKTEEQMAREIAQEDSGLGYLDAATLQKLPAEIKEKIKVLQIDGKKPTDKEYPLVMSIP